MPNCEVGKAYGFVMRAPYLPFESQEQIARITRPHRQALIEGMHLVIPGMLVKVESGVTRSLNKSDLDPRYSVAE